MVLKWIEWFTKAQTGPKLFRQTNNVSWWLKLNQNRSDRLKIVQKVQTGLELDEDVIGLVWFTCEHQKMEQVWYGSHASTRRCHWFGMVHKRAPEDGTGLVWFTSEHQKMEQVWYGSQQSTRKRSWFGMVHTRPPEDGISLVWFTCEHQKMEQVWYGSHESTKRWHWFGMV